MKTKAYGLYCKKCHRLIDDTQAQYLVYDISAEEAMDQLNDPLKEHDLNKHGNDTEFPQFQLVILKSDFKPS